jgi:RNA polymerase primary sigma factor
MGKNESDNWLGTYGGEVNKYKLINTKREKILSNKVKGGDLDARNELVTANLKLVIKIARGYSDYGVSTDELISLGNYGLIVAANRFDGNMNVKFSVYACNWIKYYIRKAVIDNSKKKKVEIDIIDNEANNSIENLSVNDEELKVDNEIQDKRFSDVMVKINALTPRESNIIKHYFGIDGCDEKNLSDISKIYNISSMMVSKIIENSLRKIKCEVVQDMVFSKD